MVTVLLGSFLAASESTALLSTLVDETLIPHDTAAAAAAAPKIRGLMKYGSESSPHLPEKGQEKRSLLRALLLSRSLSSQQHGSSDLAAEEPSPLATTPPSSPVTTTTPHHRMSHVELLYHIASLWYVMVILTAAFSYVFANPVSYVLWHVGTVLVYGFFFYEHLPLLVNVFSDHKTSKFSWPWFIRAIFHSAILYFWIMSSYFWIMSGDADFDRKYMDCAHGLQISSSFFELFVRLSDGSIQKEMKLITHMAKDGGNKSRSLSWSR